MLPTRFRIGGSSFHAGELLHCDFGIGHQCRNSRWKIINLYANGFRANGLQIKNQTLQIDNYFLAFSRVLGYIGGFQAFEILAMHEENLLKCNSCLLRFIEFFSNFVYSADKRLQYVIDFIGAKPIADEMHVLNGKCKILDHTNAVVKPLFFQCFIKLCRGKSATILLLKL
ncbi:hypothetical protein A4F85_06630 [Delftia sp. GW456-R20]|nr:hypothetical protein A4F85_06630 [Delftia sp. GW456-R20]